MVVTLLIAASSAIAVPAGRNNHARPASVPADNARGIPRIPGPSVIEHKNVNGPVNLETMTNNYVILRE